jgi:hypothetical protein
MSASMARRPVGTRAQPRSDTALFAHIAYRLEGMATSEIGPYATEVLHIKAGENAIRKAPATSSRLQDVASPDAALRPWLNVDADALDFFTAVVRLRCRRHGRYAGIDKVPGVTQLFRLEASDELLAVVLYERRSDQIRLRARLGELAEIITWEIVARQTLNPAITTWRALARDAAEREGLLIEPQA